MTQAYSTLRIAPGDDGVLGVVLDAPPMNLIGPELVRDLVSLLAELESGQETRVVVLESADPDYFVPHVDLTKVAEYTAEAAKGRTAALFAQGLQTRGPLELDLGDRLGTL
jgi:enoyl-CoA hydratase/carnithine racemase